MADALRGSRVLIVEDDGIIALDLRMVIEGAGCRIVALEFTVEEGARRARDEQLDMALLDVQVNGSTTFELADTLIARRIPFVFLTGYSAESLPDRFAANRVVRKPFSPKRLLSALDQVMRRAGSPQVAAAAEAPRARGPEPPSAPTGQVASGGRKAP